MNIRIGVIQGGILSPKLFNIFYDTLINKIDNLKYFIIAYADDVTIAVIYEDQIKKVLNVIDEWAYNFDMKFNKNKSVIMFHKKANRYEELDKVEGLKQVEETRVLGYIMNK